MTWSSTFQHTFLPIFELTTLLLTKLPQSFVRAARMLCLVNECQLALAQRASNTYSAWIVLTGEEERRVCNASDATRRASTYWSGLWVSRTGVIRRASQLFLVKLCQLVVAWLISPPWRARDDERSARLLCFFSTLLLVSALFALLIIRCPFCACNTEV
jgi:hypothetical protein